MVIWAAIRENLSSGFPTKRDSNQSPQLQRLASMLVASLDMILSNNKGTDQTAWMRSLVCACVVRKPRRQVFSHRGPYDKWASTRENLSLGVCEHHRRRPACALAQSDQRLCYSRFGKYHI